MKQTDKRIYTFEELVNQTAPSKKEYLKTKYRVSLAQSSGSDMQDKILDRFRIRTGYYSLKTRILKNPWLKSRPATKAIKWLFSEVFKDAGTYRYAKRLLMQGSLFIFEYKNPKYKDTSVLPWFDKFPLVLSLGPVVTEQGIRNIGFNLHLLPPKIRIIVICQVFEIYKRLYRYQVFMKNEKPVSIHYKVIVKALEMYGVKFAVRMYIPARMQQIVKFPIKTWYKAIFIPSRGYDNIRAAKLIKEWRTYCRANGSAINPNLDWKSQI